MMSSAKAPAGVSIGGRMNPGFEAILTPEAIAFVAALERKFGAERKRLLAKRVEVEGKLNLREAITGTITYDDPASGKHYQLNAKIAVLKVRPRGWHLPENHLLV